MRKLIPCFHLLGGEYSDLLGQGCAKTIRVICFLMLTALVPMMAQQTRKSEPIQGQYVVVFKKGSLTGGRTLAGKPYELRQQVMREEATATLKRYNLEQHKVLHVYETALAGFSVSGLTKAEADRLAKDPRIAYLEQDQTVYLSDMGQSETFMPPTATPCEKAIIINGQNYVTGSAEFGPQVFNVTAEIVLVNDGTGTLTDACSAVTNTITGKIAVIDRGSCEFGFKALQAQNAGAVGVIIVNNASGAAPGMAIGTSGGSVTIPVLSLSLADGNTVKAAMLNGTVSATMLSQFGVGGQCTPWGIARVGGGLSGAGKRAWIIDSGIDLDHPDLNVNATLGASFNDIESDLDDHNGHGSHVSGTIAALDNGFGVIGVAAGAEVVPVKVFSASGDASYEIVIAAVNFVAAHAQSGEVCNMSLGGSFNAALNNAVIAASAVCSFTLSAGNDAQSATNASPASANGANIYTVSAIDIYDQRAYFTNYGNPPIDYAAPGLNVASCSKDGGYAFNSGTSMSAPHIAGLVLLGKICSINNMLNDIDGTPDPIAIHDVTSDSDNDGVTVCNGDCNDSDASIYKNATELCDAKDNDCDGSTDEGIATAACSVGIGECLSTGTISCVGGQMICSAVAGTPTAETCNSLDDNCDGVVDNVSNTSTCPAITGLAVSGVTESSATISCNVACTAKYRRMIRKTSANVWGYADFNQPTVSSTVSGLLSATQYGVRMRTLCSATILGSLSSEKKFTTLGSLPLMGSQGNIPEGIETSRVTDTEPIVSIYPNPSTGQINLDVTALTDQPVSIIISDNSGRNIMARRTKIQSGNLFESFDLTNMPTGIYILRLKLDDGNNITRTIIKN